jgi:hypothetical protein
MSPEEEDYFLNPPPGSAAERAVTAGVDLKLTLENLRRTPEERIRRLDRRLEEAAREKRADLKPDPSARDKCD